MDVNAGGNILGAVLIGVPIIGLILRYVFRLALNKLQEKEERAAVESKNAANAGKRVKLSDLYRDDDKTI